MERIEMSNLLHHLRGKLSDCENRQLEILNLPMVLSPELINELKDLTKINTRITKELMARCK